MNRKDISVEVAEKMGITQAFARDVVDAVLESIQESLLRGERVELRNFGVFFTSRTGEKIVKVPRTDLKLRLPETRIARFRPGKSLKQRLK